MESTSESSADKSSDSAETSAASAEVTDMMENLSINVDSQDAVISKIPVTGTDRFTKPSDTIAAFESQDPAEIVKACNYLRHILSNERAPPVQQVVEAGCLPYLIRCLKFKNNYKIQFEAAWAITNIASSESRFSKAVIDEGAVLPLVELLQSRSWEISEQAVWAIGNIAGDGVALRDRLVDLGVLDELINLVRTVQERRRPYPNSYIHNLTWTLSNMFRFKPHPHIRYMLPCLPLLRVFLTTGDDETVTNTIWTISYMSESETLSEPTSASVLPSQDLVIDALLEADIIPTLRGFLSSTSLNYVLPSMRVFGNICTRSVKYVNDMISAGIITHFIPLLSNRNHIVRKEAFWTMSNIAAGSTDQLQALIDAGVIGACHDGTTDDKEGVRKEAGWVVCNAVSVGSPAQIISMADNNHVIESLVETLKLHDISLLKLALSSLETVIRNGRSPGRANPYVETFNRVNGANILNRLLDNNDYSLHDAAQSLLDMLSNQE